MSSSKCSFTCIWGIFRPLTLPRLQFMLGLHFTPTCVLLLVCSLHFTLSLHFTPGPHSAVCSPQSAFYSDRRKNTVLGTLYMALVVLHVCLYPFPSPSPITPTNNNYKLLCNTTTFHILFCSKSMRMSNAAKSLATKQNISPSHIWSSI